ncbi:MAG: UDP-N-acetylmuramoyl-tripeptide--D-alanyl-D-alanine ligase [Gammaproteobacteria bacterium]|nr:UDP-N-acetylmuramoyl-tripeptide--D-alanyl-D-alanine ligase [Gammaproteobacteria bacterium]
MRLSDAALAIGGTLLGEDAPFRGVSTDSRTLEPGALFVALRGENFDGHDWLDAAVAAGAAGVVIEGSGPAPAAAIRVDDTRRALGALAASWRSGFELPVIAITGSNGKTTVKEMTAAILRQERRVLATEGNLNNDIGVPQTLFRLNAQHDAAVIEMGANHAGEIGGLVALARPTVAAITLCAPAHLEGFGSIEGVARAKGEIFAGLDAGSTAVLNVDDDYADYWRGIIGTRSTLGFGLGGAADVTARDIKFDTGALHTSFTLVTPAGEAPVTLPLAGRHNVMNALAASACSLAAGSSLNAIVAGLAELQPVPGRLALKPGKRGSSIIDDTYNANPESLQAALDVLAQRPGRRWLALGDMGELGEDAETLHAKAGTAARTAGVEQLFTAGALARASAAAFGAGAQQFETGDELAAAVGARLDDDVTVLVKASRSMHFETVVRALVANGEQRC